MTDDAEQRLNEHSKTTSRGMEQAIRLTVQAIKAYEVGKLTSALELLDGARRQNTQARQAIGQESLMNGDMQHPLGPSDTGPDDHGDDEPQGPGAAINVSLILANAELGIAYTDLLVVCSTLLKNAGGISVRVTQHDLDEVALLVDNPLKIPAVAARASSTELAIKVTELQDDLAAARRAGSIEGLQRALKRADEAIRAESSC